MAVPNKASKLGIYDAIWGGRSGDNASRGSVDASGTCLKCMSVRPITYTITGWGMSDIDRSAGVSRPYHDLAYGKVPSKRGLGTAWFRIRIVDSNIICGLAGAETQRGPQWQVLENGSPLTGLRSKGQSHPNTTFLN